MRRATWGDTLHTDVPPGDLAPFVGRADLLAAIEARLAAGGSILLTGPAGIGKTALLDAVAAAASARGERVLRVFPAHADRDLPFAALADLLRQIPPATVAILPPGQRAAVEAVLGQRTGGPRPGREAELARRLAWLALLDRCAAAGPVLLVFDDIQWFDQPSANVVGYAHRRLARPGTGTVRAVAALPSPDAERDPLDVTATAARLCPSPVVDVTVPPLTAGDLADLLDAYGVPYRTGCALHADSGGNPQLALTLREALSDAGDLATPPDRLRALLLHRLGALAADAHHTLLLAAISAANRPDLSVLRAACGRDVDRDLRAAETAGLITMDGPVVRFTPTALAGLLIEQAGPRRCADARRALAGATVDPAERAWHLASVDTAPDAVAAGALAEAADAARRHDFRGVVARLYLLAADRTPGTDHDTKLDRLVSAAEAAAETGHDELARRAAATVLAADTDAARRVRVRLAVADVAGQALADMDETLTAARAEAGDDPALLAPLKLRLAWQALERGALSRVEREATQAVKYAESAGDTGTMAMAMAVRAWWERTTGDPRYADTLAEALALTDQPPGPPGAPARPARLPHLGPRFLAAQFAFFDDRLDEARTGLLRMLADAQRGSGETVVAVLRALAEVGARAGRCAEALDYARRASRAAGRAGLSPGPCWYTEAVAELAGGSLRRADAHARRGVRASEQEHDNVFLGRNLHALGQARIRAGDLRGGVAALRRLRGIRIGVPGGSPSSVGTGDPSMLRWHGDLAVGLAMLGEHAEAVRTLAAARHGAEALERSPAVPAHLDRAAAVVWAQAGDADRAVSLAASAAHRFADLGQPIEQGHALLVLGQAERRRRRYAAARTATRSALALFLEVGAAPWARQAGRALAPDGPGSDPERHRGADPAQRLNPAQQVHPAAALTSTEARIAALVQEGASNRDIAARLYLSVKTVEATLTRVYRKLGVRSRTQLTSLLNRT